MSIYNSSNEVVEEITDCLSIDAEQIQLSLYGAFKHSVTKIERLEAENALLNEKIDILSNHIFVSRQSRLKTRNASKCLTGQS